MRLTVLGSNAGSPSPGNPASGYLVVSSEDAAVWVDAGPGTFMKLGALMDPADLSAVVLSHTHVDHCADVLALFAYLAYGLRESTDPIIVFAPQGTRDHVSAFVRADADHALHRVLEFVEVDPGDEVQVSDLAMTFGEAVHPVPALGVRFEDASTSLTYSGETGPGGDLIELATGSDVLLCEASIQGLRDDDTYAYHLTAFEAAEIASTAAVGELILTHIPFSLDTQLSIDQASSAFVGPPISYAAPDTTFSWE